MLRNKACGQLDHVLDWMTGGKKPYVVRRHVLGDVDHLLICAYPYEVQRDQHSAHGELLMARLIEDEKHAV